MPCIHFCGSNFVIPCIKSNQTLKQYFGGDIQKFSEKLPGFIWSKYPKEKHLPSYNYLGPGTRLDIRLDENNLPKPGEEPINEIDRIAYIHDLAYQKSSNIQDRHRADLDMIEGLKGLQNLSFLQKLIKALIIKLFKTKIKLGGGTRAAKAQAIENLYKQPTEKTKDRTDTPKGRADGTPKERKILANELHKPFRRPKQLRKINFRSKDNIWNADLLHMPEEDSRNDPYKYILTVLDGYTRYAWAVPLKHKDGLSVSNAFKEIMRKSERRPRKLWVDQGKEFYNEHMYKCNPNQH